MEPPGLGPGPGPGSSCGSPSPAAAAPPVLLSADVALHNRRGDAWVTLSGTVLDVTGVIDREPDARRAAVLLRRAGGAVDDLFDARTGEPRTFVSPVTGLREPFCPDGGGVPPPGVALVAPTTEGFDASSTPWWRDGRLVVGRLSARPRGRRLRVINTLTGQDDVVDVPDELTLGEMQRRCFARFNSACGSAYEWRALVGGRPAVLDAGKTLAGNGLPCDAPAVEALGLDPAGVPLVLALVFRDGSDPGAAVG